MRFLCVMKRMGRLAYVGHEEDDDERRDGFGHTAHQRVHHAHLTTHQNIHPHSLSRAVSPLLEVSSDVSAFRSIFALTRRWRRTGISIYEGILQTYGDQQELCRLVDLVQECRQEARHIDNLIHVAINPISPQRLARHPVAYRLYTISRVHLPTSRMFGPPLASRLAASVGVKPS